VCEHEQQKECALEADEEVEASRTVLVQVARATHSHPKTSTN